MPITPMTLERGQLRKKIAASKADAVEEKGTGEANHRLVVSVHK